MLQARGHLLLCQTPPGFPLTGPSWLGTGTDPERAHTRLGSFDLSSCTLHPPFRIEIS